MPNIMTLAQAVLQIFCSQGRFTTQNASQKREIIQSNTVFYRILPKVNQIIYTMDTICEPNIMILAEAVLEIFCSQGSIGLVEKTSEKGHKSATTSPTEKKKKYVSAYFSYLLRTSNFKILSLTVLDRMQSVTHHAPTQTNTVKRETFTPSNFRGQY